MALCTDWSIKYQMLAIVLTKRPLVNYNCLYRSVALFGHVVVILTCGKTGITKDIKGFSKIE